MFSLNFTNGKKEHPNYKIVSERNCKDDYELIMKVARKLKLKLVDDNLFSLPVNIIRIK